MPRRRSSNLQPSSRRIITRSIWAVRMGTRSSAAAKTICLSLAHRVPARRRASSRQRSRATQGRSLLYRRGPTCWQTALRPVVPSQAATAAPCSNSAWLAHTSSQDWPLCGGILLTAAISGRQHSHRGRISSAPSARHRHHMARLRFRGPVGLPPCRKVARTFRRKDG